MGVVVAVVVDGERADGEALTAWVSGIRSCGVLTALTGELNHPRDTPTTSTTKTRPAHPVLACLDSTNPIRRFTRLPDLTLGYSKPFLHVGVRRAGFGPWQHPGVSDVPLIPTIGTRRQGGRPRRSRKIKQRSRLSKSAISGSSHAIPKLLPSPLTKRRRQVPLRGLGRQRQHPRRHRLGGHDPSPSVHGQ